jgi:hypothetical protein
MIEKEKLLQILKEALEGEEKLVSIFTGHLETASFWLGLKRENLAGIRGGMEYLAQESLRHKKICESLIARIGEGQQNAF